MDKSLVIKDQIKLAKVAAKADKEARQAEILRSLVNSPLVQIIGVVAVCEILEKYELISGSWASAIEAGTVAVVGLHTLKEYGVMGLGLTSAAGLGGAIAGAESPLNAILGLLRYTPFAPISPQ